MWRTVEGLHWKKLGGCSNPWCDAPPLANWCECPTLILVGFQLRKDIRNNKRWSGWKSWTTYTCLQKKVEKKIPWLFTIVHCLPWRSTCVNLMFDRIDKYCLLKKSPQARRQTKTRIQDPRRKFNSTHPGRSSCLGRYRLAPFLWLDGAGEKGLVTLGYSLCKSGMLLNINVTCKLSNLFWCVKS